MRENLKMHYLDEGKKTDECPILMLHGNPTWSFYYRKVVSALKEEARCIAPDHIGCGLSDKPKSSEFSYDLKSHSSNILSLLDHLQVERVKLVLHDWGGAIGLTALKDQPERIDRIALLNTAAFPSKDVPWRILLCRFPLIGLFIVRALNGFAQPATWMATSKGLSQQAKTGYLHPYQNWRDRIAIWKFVKDIPLEPNHPSLPLLRKTEESLSSLKELPSLACWGMNDFCFHQGYLNRWEEIWPSLVIHRFKKAGHYILEDSLEDCLKVMKPFLLK